MQYYRLKDNIFKKKNGFTKLLTEVFINPRSPKFLFCNIFYNITHLFTNSISPTRFSMKFFPLFVCNHRPLLQHLLITLPVANLRWRCTHISSALLFTPCASFYRHCYTLLLLNAHSFVLSNLLR